MRLRGVAERDICHQDTEVVAMLHHRWLATERGNPRLRAYVEKTLTESSVFVRLSCDASSSSIGKQTWARKMLQLPDCTTRAAIAKCLMMEMRE